MLIRRALVIGIDIRALLPDMRLASGRKSKIGRCKPRRQRLLRTSRRRCRAYRTRLLARDVP
jgi:hypothetical protein